MRIVSLLHYVHTKRVFGMPVHIRAEAKGEGDSGRCVESDTLFVEGPSPPHVIGPQESIRPVLIHLRAVTGLSNSETCACLFLGRAGDQFSVSELVRGGAGRATGRDWAGMPKSNSQMGGVRDATTELVGVGGT